MNVPPAIQNPINMETLRKRYPGAPAPFLRAFIRSGRSMRHFLAMRWAWHDAGEHARLLARDVPGNGMLNHSLNSDF